MGSKWPCQFQNYWKQKQKRPGSRLFQQSQPLRLLPVAIHNISHELGGPEIGAAVNLFSAPRTSFLIWLCFRQPGVVLVLLSCLALHFQIGHCSGSAMLLSSGISGLNRLIATGDNFFPPTCGWCSSCHESPSSRFNTLQTSLETSSLEGSQKASMDRHIQRVSNV
ncbi:hypothetical protein EDB85DRAFT_506207 [Lactarius pseudohatsudake]|nr:hypothetical protein EDB85DRAFT_506207 [Lactarius pseudohatsudake]